MGMIWLVYRNYQSERFIAFDIWQPGAMYVSLMATGFFFNLGAWIDKLMFWYFPGTGQHVIGPLNASVIYDFPIFLSYLSVIPGMAVFLVRIETDFVEYYVKFYDAVREGATLDYIERMRNHMVYHVRRGLFDIAKIQSITVLITFSLGEILLKTLGISTLYLPLLYVDVVGASLQVVLLGILNVLFYLDQRRAVVFLTATLPALNMALTALSLHLGASWFGYGFALAMLITVLLGIWILNRKLEVLEYETFMLQ
jgi:polysaccharide biosynthesis protein PelG